MLYLCVWYKCACLRVSVCECECVNRNVRSKVLPEHKLKQIYRNKIYVYQTLIDSLQSIKKYFYCSAWQMMASKLLTALAQTVCDKSSYFGNNYFYMKISCVSSVYLSKNPVVLLYLLFKLLDCYLFCDFWVSAVLHDRRCLRQWKIVLAITVRNNYCYSGNNCFFI